MDYYLQVTVGNEYPIPFIYPLILVIRSIYTVKHFRSSRPFLVWTYVDLMVAGILMVIFNAVLHLNIIPCTAPLAQNLILSILAPLVAQVILIYCSGLFHNRVVLIIPLFILILILWLGAYQFSPLGYSTGSIPILEGFIITRPNRSSINIRSRAIVTISIDSVMEIQPVTSVADGTCYWVAANGGGIDDPRNCDIAYQPPQAADVDTLNILFQPGCHLPNAHGDIKISVLH
jgi:hypothetical protein